jgi:hypothetical protein
MVEFKTGAGNDTVTIKDRAFYVRVSAAAHRHETSRAEILRKVVGQWLDTDERHDLNGGD